MIVSPGLRNFLVGCVFGIAAGAFVMLILFPLIKMAIACSGDCRASLGG